MSEWSSVLARLATAPLDYQTSRFVLRTDLERLLEVSRVGAPEAMIFYGAGILEALAADALEQLGLEPGAHVFSNLTLLEHLNRLDTSARYWAHALRRLGNQVRHIHCFVGPDQAELAAHFAERWLEWYFCRFSHGPRLESLTRDRLPLGLAAREEEGRVLRLVEEFEAQPRSAAELPGVPGFLRTPVLPAAVAEMLLGRKREADALHLLEMGLERFPADVRLQQLMGLYWRRAGNLERALEYLRPLGAAGDEETAGLLAAVLKQQWLNNRADRIALEGAHRAYKDAWAASHPRNTWLGINAAATALFLAKVDRARHLALAVEATLQDRAARLPVALRDAALEFSYWDHVTLAEAQLLAGDRATAERTYAEAFTRNAHRTGDIEVSLGQKTEILRALGLAPGP
jgi:hypothetical protein